LLARFAYLRVMLSFPTRRSSDLLGRIWRNMIVRSLTPNARAARTYSKLRARRNSARTTPTNAGQPNRIETKTKSQKLRPRIANRSEEHTSELQSRENLVCRLLLE